MDSYHSGWAEGRSARLRGNERRFLDEIVRACTDAGVLLCREVSFEAIEGFRAQLLAKGNAPASINRKLNTFRGLLNWMRKRGYLTMSGDEIKDACAHSKVEVKAPNVLNAGQVNAIIEASIALDEDMLANRGRRRASSVALALMLCGGLRMGEVHHISSESFYLDADGKPIMIRVYGSKTNRIRHLPTHDSEILCRVSNYVASHGIKGPWTASLSRSSWNRIRKATKIEATPNDLRKTCIAATASLSGLSEYLLEERFGHSHGVSVKHYRQPIYRENAGKTVESWLGIEKNLVSNAYEMCIRILSEKISGTILDDAPRFD